MTGLAARQSAGNAADKQVLAELEDDREGVVVPLIAKRTMKNEGIRKDVPLKWKAERLAWLTWLKAAGKGEGTVKLRGSQIAKLARAFPHHSPWTLTLDDLTQWIAGHDWQGDTLRSYRAALRSFWSWGMATARATIDPTMSLSPAPTKTPVPRPAPEHIIDAALQRSDQRLQAMIRAGREAGLRSIEISRIHLSDFFQEHYDDGTLAWSLIAHGKGDKDRVVPLTDDLARELMTRCRDHAGGWCFPGRINGHLSGKRVSELLSEALGPYWSGHNLRHTFSSAAYAQTRDLRAVQELLGHASPTTTQIYTAVPNGAKRRAVLLASRTASAAGASPAVPPAAAAPPRSSRFVQAA